MTRLQTLRIYKAALKDKRVWERTREAVDMCKSKLEMKMLLEWYKIDGDPPSKYVHRISLTYQSDAWGIPIASIDVGDWTGTGDRELAVTIMQGTAMEAHPIVCQNKGSWSRQAIDGRSVASTGALGH